jgi:hypothetical protein
MQNKIYTLFLILSFTFFTEQLFAATGDSLDTAETITVNSNINGTLKYTWRNNRRYSGKYYNYTFEVPSTGTIHIYSTGFDSDTDIDVYNERKEHLTSDKSASNNINITFDATQQTYYLDIYNYNEYLEDDFILYIEFTPDNTSTNSLDICYDPLIESGINLGPVSFLNKTTIPLKQTGDDELTNVEVALGTSSLFSAFEDCGVDDGTGTCEDANGASFMVFSAFNDGVLFKLENLSPDETISPYTESTFSLFDSNNFDIVASYEKNGISYQGVVQPCSVESSGGRDFELRHKINLYGDVKVIGNTVLCELENGVCKEPTTNNSNSETNLQKAPQSTSELLIPPGAVIQYARLYWQGRLAATSQNEAWDATSKADAKKIKFKKDGEAYATFIADIGDFSTTESINYVRIYHASANVTQYLKHHGEGNYSIDTQSFYTHTGKTYEQSPRDGLGAYGAWALVVIYEDINNGLYKNVAIFDGYKTVSSSSGDVDITTSGFLTPRFGSVNSQTYAFVAEGDKYISGDHIYMSGVDNPTTPMKDLGTFDSRIDVDATRDPNLLNNNGIDIRYWNVGTDGENIIKNNETGANFKFTSTQDTYFPSLIVFSTELYVPKFCYDYAYKQQGVYFTEKNDGTKLPRIVGDVITNEAVDVTVYIRNLVESDIDITNMVVNVVDINTSQAKYIRETTKLAKEGDIIASNVADASLDVADNYIKGIDIGTITSNEFFYLYYSLDPSQSDLNISLTVEADYNLSIDGGEPIPYHLVVGKNMQMCSSSNFKYAPAKGIFNIVHNDYYNLDAGGGQHYYNLPTQVSSRVGNFKILSMDPENLDTLKPTSTIVAVDMIDAAAFHDTNASCNELSSSISKRVWVTFDNNSTSAPFNKAALENAIIKGATKLLTSSEFYTTAKQNAAFRVSYNTTNDGESSLIQHTYDSVHDKYKINNFTELVQTVGTCSQEVTFPVGNSNVTTTEVAVACGNAGTYISKAQYTACMECLYGINTRLVCSRDNFAIRPEAFMMHLKDQNQSNPAQTIALTTTLNSGSVGATAPVLDLASGYNYKFEVNATNHMNNSATPGYTRSMNIDTTAVAQYTWQPEDGRIVSGCNAPVDVNISSRFLNGLLDINTSLNNVGEYRLNIVDKSWTLVDSNPNYMVHHTGHYFIDTPDCKVDSSTVLVTNTPLNPNSNPTLSILNGCQISSQHKNNETNLQYNDYNVTFHPYKFNMQGILPSSGKNRTPLTSNSYLYYADIMQADQESMAYHLDGIISAQGENNVTLSNFVDSCYAVALDLEIVTLNSRLLKDTNDNNVSYIARFHDLNTTASVVSTLDVNVTDTTPTAALVVPTTAAHFLKELQGNISTQLNLNYARKKDTPINPFVLNFVEYKAKCTDTSKCFFRANLTTKTSEGKKDLNASLAIPHYYGRTHVMRQQYKGTDGNASIYYEVYCDGVSCNKNLLKDGNTSLFSDDPRWFINTQHTAATGVPGDAKQKSAPIRVTATTHGINYFSLQYDASRGYPYKTTMENNASQWLIYNKYNPSATKNSFEVEFINPSGDWAGIHETNATTKQNASKTSNRRTLW